MFFSEPTDSSTTLSDESLLDLSLRSPQVFNILLLRYQDKLHRRALTILRSEEDAKDAVQEAFVSMYLHAGQFKMKSDATFSSWAYTIISNKCFTIYKKRKNNSTRFVNMSPELEGILSDRNELVAYENKDLVNRTLDRLPKTFRTVVEKIYQGHSYEEIALAENITESSVRSRLHRAKKLLKSFAKELKVFC